MEEQKYFKQAVSDFTFEAACGGAIRHLADLGYSVKQIMEQLSFRVPYERVQKTVWEHYLNTGILLLEEPGKGKIREKADYVREYNQYGKASFRRVVKKEANMEEISFRKIYYDQNQNGTFEEYFTKKSKENGWDAYVLLDFGTGDEKGISMKESLQALNSRQQEYVEGLFGEKKKTFYHRLNGIMSDIIIRLYENGAYHGKCYFIKTKETLIL